MPTQSTESRLEAARGGDAEQFQQLVAPYRRELEGHCYRLTGSLADAEDLVQESLVRAWRGLAGFEGRSSLRTWLYRIATNLCLTELERRPRRHLPLGLGPPLESGSPIAAPVVDPIWLDPCPPELWRGMVQGPDARYSARQSVALAFLVALQSLPPLQRAVLVLRDVLDLPAAEVAELLETTTAAVNSALQRARATVGDRQERREEAVKPAPIDASTDALMQRYLAAWETGDADGLVSLLREDASLSMPPVPSWFRGRETIRAFLQPLWSTLGEVRARLIEVSGAPGLAAWVRAPGEERFLAHDLQVLTLDDTGAVAAVDVFINPDLFPRFGLPSEL